MNSTTANAFFAPHWWGSSFVPRLSPFAAKKKKERKGETLIKFVT